MGASLFRPFAVPPRTYLFMKTQSTIEADVARDRIGRFAAQTNSGPETALQATAPEWFGRLTPEDIAEMAGAAA